MVIRRNDVLGKTDPHKSNPTANGGSQKPVEITPEQKQAIDLLRSVDSGMTLLRFQVQVATGEVTPGIAPYDVDNMVKSAVFALTHGETTDTDEEKITALAIALEAIVIAIDALDYSLEDVARKVLNELR